MSSTPHFSSEQMLALDIIQTHALRNIFSNKIAGAIADEVVVKGGIGMQAAARSKRWTSDIDLGATSSLMGDHARHFTLKKRMTQVMNKTIRDISLHGILTDVVCSMPKDSDSTMRWKINGKLPDGSVVSMKIELSGRHELPPENIRNFAFTQRENGSMQGFTVRSYDHQLLAASKVGSMLSGENGELNMRTKPRDVYDLFVLIEINVEPPVELLAVLGKERLEQSIDEIGEKISMMDWDMVKTNLRPYLPEAEAAELTEDTWDSMRTTTMLHVEAWIRAAIKLCEEREGQETMNSVALGRAA